MKGGRGTGTEKGGEGERKREYQEGGRKVNEGGRIERRKRKKKMRV